AGEVGAGVADRGQREVRVVRVDVRAVAAAADAAVVRGDLAGAGRAARGRHGQRLLIEGERGADGARLIHRDVAAVAGAGARAAPRGGVRAGAVLRDQVDGGAVVVRARTVAAADRVAVGDRAVAGDGERERLARLEARLHRGVAGEGDRALVVRRA